MARSQVRIDPDLHGFLFPVPAECVTGFSTATSKGAERGRCRGLRVGKRAEAGAEVGVGVEMRVGVEVRVGVRVDRSIAVQVGVWVSIAVGVGKIRWIGPGIALARATLSP